MKKKYRVKRSVVVTVTDVMYDNRTPEELKKQLDAGAMSIAGEISKLGLAKFHKIVSYGFGDTIIEEIKE